MSALPAGGIPRRRLVALACGLLVAVLALLAAPALPAPVVAAVEGSVDRALHHLGAELPWLPAATRAGEATR